MEFHTLKRRDLQILCKKNNIPANTTNAAMADALASLDLVEGIEEFLGQTEVKDVSPEKSVITSPNMPRTSTQHRVRIEESECSKLATRTRCSTRRTALAGTDTKQTPVTRTSRRTARKIQHDIQAEYEVSLEESEVSNNKEILPNECESLEESNLSGVVDQDDNISSEKQIESRGHADDREEVVSEVQVMSGETSNVSLKVDLHSLSRKQLQNLCKRNKIPANITNAAMIDALEALESVEGLEDLLKESDPLAIKSPEMSRMTSSRVCQSRTARKTTCIKPSQTRSTLGKMTVQKKDDNVMQSLAKKMDATVEDVECSGAESKPLSEKSSDDSATSIVVETPKEPLDDVDESSNPTNIVTFDDAPVHKENPLSEIENTSQEDALETDGDVQEFKATELVESIANNESLESATASLNHPNSNEGESQLLSDEVSDEPVTSLMMENIKELQDDVIENEVEGENDSFETDQKPVADQKTADVAEEELILLETLCEKPIVNESVALMPEAALGTKVKLSDTSVFNDVQEDETALQDDDARGDDMEILDQLGDRVDEIDGIEFGDMSNVDLVDVEIVDEIDRIEFGDMSIVDSVDVEVIGDMENVEGSKSISNRATQDENPLLDSDSVQYSMKMHELSCFEINTEKETESCQEKADEPIIVSDAAANECEVEEQEGSCTDDQTTKEVSSDLTAKATEHAPEPKGTPLNYKSLRKLKKMLKEKLQATTSLTSKMEKLTLDEIDAEPVQEACQNLNEQCEKIETSGIISAIASGIAEAPTPAVVTGNDDVDEESTQTNIDKAVNGLTVDAATQIQNCVESVKSNSTLKIEGNDESEKQTTEQVIPLQEVDESDASLQFSPVQSLKKTPSKSSSKTMSTGRKNNAVDMNKENIDKSGSKTGPGKTEMAVFGTGKLLSPLSMRMLKKELQQQSEKKRRALQSRSENQCPLSSP